MRAPHALPVFISLSLILGMGLGFCIHVEPHIQYAALGGCLIFFIIAFFRARKQFLQDALFGISAFMVLVALGFVVTRFHQPSFNPQHYLHRKLSAPAQMTLKIRKPLKPNQYYESFIAEVQALQQHPAEGKVLLRISRGSVPAALRVGDRIKVRTRLIPIYPPLNPHQFDYAAYMRHKKVYKQVKIDRRGYLRLPRQKKSVLGLAAKLRQQLDRDLKSYAFSQNQRALIEALLLGQRNELSKETYHHFIDAGVVHVLAVSGLHVGILMVFLFLVFKPLILLPHGKIIRQILVILLLWGYACIAGLSPSILRAVTMFSFFSFGLFFKRRVITLNMLCLSAVVLLLYNPNFLLTVGFQLSYAAVLSIIIFRKKIFNIFHLKNKALRYGWQICSVTLAAQLGVLPISLFYFHQFPGLFFLSNIVIIPFLGLILGTGVFVLLLAGIGHLPHFLVVAYGGVLDSLQFVVDWVAGKESFLFKQIYFSGTMLLISCLLILFLGFLIYRRRKIYLYLCLLAVLALEADVLREYHRLGQTRKFYVFHKIRHSLLGFQRGHHLKIITDMNREQVMTLSFISGFEQAENIETLKISEGLQNYYVLGTHRLFIIDSAAVTTLPDTTGVSDILLRQSPKINLERVIDSLRPHLVLADGSNYKNSVLRWRRTCKKMNVRFHYTGKKGAVGWPY